MILQQCRSTVAATVALLRTIRTGLPQKSPKNPYLLFIPLIPFLREMTMRRTRLTYDKILADIQSLSRDHGWIGQDLPDPLVVSV